MLSVHVALIAVFAVVIRGLVSLHPYSGEGQGPMFGDYEAQRHWMEITYQLPVKQWYVNSTENDLMYWGLDYPPLTAYHSWILGYIQAKFINSTWVELFKSRGLESYEHKLFMRYSVLVLDALIYIPAVLVFFLKCNKRISVNANLVFACLTLIQPALLLIDHGHFQYNCISLGLALWAIIGLSSSHDLIGSVSFVLALNYKQMELYHALPFFAYLLGSCFRKYGSGSDWLSGLLKLIKLALVVLVAFLVCWWPFLRDLDISLASQVLHRLFPFARGLYEDKVANVWCSISVFVKLKNIFDASTLVKICLGSTAIALLPTSIDVLLRPSITKFKYALVNSSLIFFLFSFQVHEKSILLASLPVCLLMSDNVLLAIWFLLVATFSMVPLFIKDGLIIAYLGSAVMFYIMADVLIDQLHLADRVVQKQADLAATTTVPEKVQQRRLHSNKLTSNLFWASVLGMCLLTAASLLVTPPQRLPDLHAVLISFYACIHFIYFLVYFHWAQFTSSSTAAVDCVTKSVELKQAGMDSKHEHAAGTQTDVAKVKTGSISKSKKLKSQ